MPLPMPFLTISASPQPSYRALRPLELRLVTSSTVRDKDSMPFPTSLLAAILWPTLVTSYAIRALEPVKGTGGNIFDSIAEPALAKREDTSISLDFVQRWAAIGDSFTAGIGSGHRLGLPPTGSADWYCARYSYTWPQIVDRYIGTGRTNFQYPACSGDRSVGIYEQARSLEGDLNVVMLTAGGNDLCLARIYLPCSQAYITPQGFINSPWIGCYDSRVRFVAI